VDPSSRSRRWARGALPFVLCALLAPPALGQALAPPEPSAAALVGQAKREYRAQHFEAAARLFERALAAAPRDPATHYNLARSHDRLGDAAQAVRSYRNYLALKPGATDRAKVAARVATLEAGLRRSHGRCTFSSEPPGATIRVGSAEARPLGESPLEIWLPAGPQRVLFQLEGYLETAQDIELRAGATLELRAALQPRPRDATLSLEILPRGARIYVDDTLRGSAPLGEPLRLSPGPHALRVEADGHQSSAEALMLDAGARRTLRLSLTRSAAPSAGEEAPEASPLTPAAGPLAATDAAPPEPQAPAPAPEEPPSQGGPGLASWTLFGLGAVALAAGLLCGRLMLDEESGLQEDRAQPAGLERSSYDERVETAQRYQLAANLSFGVAAASGGAALLVWWLQPEPAATAPLTLRVQPTLSGGSLALSW